MQTSRFKDKSRVIDKTLIFLTGLQQQVRKKKKKKEYLGPRGMVKYLPGKMLDIHGSFIGRQKYKNDVLT